MERAAVQRGTPSTISAYTLVWAAPPARDHWPAATEAVCHLAAGSTVTLAELSRHRDRRHGAVWWARVAR